VIAQPLHHGASSLVARRFFPRELPTMTKLTKPKFFPPPELAEPAGAVMFGGQLTPEWLLDAYAHGIFPWPIFHDTDIVVWWSPDPRAIFEPARFRITRRLWRTVQGGRFEVSMDRAFAQVIHACATAGDRRGNTWITPALRAAYCRLHELGHAHSIETWLDGRLVGGTYGVALHGLFAAESMFHEERDASKVALVHLTHHLVARGYQLFDIQQLTPHTESLGAIEISRDDYLARLEQSQLAAVTFGSELAPMPAEREAVCQLAEQ
jgi:leucyl/phenylalanyl-tRNA---protein transferase